MTTLQDVFYSNSKYLSVRYILLCFIHGERDNFYSYSLNYTLPVHFYNRYLFTFVINHDLVYTLNNMIYESSLENKNNNRIRF